MYAEGPLATCVSGLSKLQIINYRVSYLLLYNDYLYVGGKNYKVSKLGGLTWT